MKNAIVIGGLSGIGKGIAKALADRDFNVIIGDINVNSSTSSDSSYFVDAVCLNSVNEFVSQVNCKIKNLDALIITVGAIDEGSVLNIPLDKWKWIFNTNLLSSIQLVDAFIPLLEKSKDSKIMLTGSGSGFGKLDKNSGLGLYAISKHALLGYFRVLHEELLEKGIQVSLLIPSSIAGSLADNSAKMRQYAFKEDLSVRKGSQPKDRFLEDADIAGIKFVADLLNGRIIITNNPSQLIEKCQNELDDLIKRLL